MAVRAVLAGATVAVAAPDLSMSGSRICLSQHATHCAPACTTHRVPWCSPILYDREQKGVFPPGVCIARATEPSGARNAGCSYCSVSKKNLQKKADMYLISALLLAVAAMFIGAELSAALAQRLFTSPLACLRSPGLMSIAGTLHECIGHLRLQLRRQLARAECRAAGCTCAPAWHPI